MRFYTAMAGLVAMLSTSARAHEPVHTLELSWGETLPYNSLRGIVSLAQSASEGAGAIVDMVEPNTPLGRWGEMTVVGLFDGFMACSGHEFSHALFFERTGGFHLAGSGMCFNPDVELGEVRTQQDVELLRLNYGSGYNFHALSAEYTIERSLFGGDISIPFEAIL